MQTAPRHVLGHFGSPATVNFSPRSAQNPVFPACRRKSLSDVAPAVGRSTARAIFPYLPHLYVK